MGDIIVWLNQAAVGPVKRWHLLAAAAVLIIVTIAVSQLKKGK